MGLLEGQTRPGQAARCRCIRKRSGSTTSRSQASGHDLRRGAYCLAARQARSSPGYRARLPKSLRRNLATWSRCENGGLRSSRSRLHPLPAVRTPSVRRIDPNFPFFFLAVRLFVCAADPPRPADRGAAAAGDLLFLASPSSPISMLSPRCSTSCTVPCCSSLYCIMRLSQRIIRRHARTIAQHARGRVQAALLYKGASLARKTLACRFCFIGRTRGGARLLFTAHEPRVVPSSVPVARRLSVAALVPRQSTL